MNNLIENLKNDTEKLVEKLGDANLTEGQNEKVNDIIRELKNLNREKPDFVKINTVTF